MTAPMFPPIRDEDELSRASRCILHWRAADLSLNGLNGEIANFSRGATSTINDGTGASFTAGYAQPDFEPVAWNGVFEMTHRMYDEVWNWPALWRPMAFAFYLEFQYFAMPSGALWSISNDAATGARVYVDASSGNYRLVHHNGTSSVSTTLADAPSAGDLITLWGFVTSTGAVQLNQQRNTSVATAVAFSSGLTLASTWGSGTAKTRICALGTTSGSTAGTRFRTIKLVAGTPTFAQLQRYF